MPERTNGSATNSFSLSCLLFFFIQECRIPLRQYSTCTKFFLFIFSYAALSTTTTTTSRRFCSLSTELRVFLFLLSPSSSTPASLSTQIHIHKNYEGIREKKEHERDPTYFRFFNPLYELYRERKSTFICICVRWSGKTSRFSGGGRREKKECEKRFLLGVLRRIFWFFSSYLNCI